MLIITSTCQVNASTYYDCADGIFHHGIDNYPPAVSLLAAPVDLMTACGYEHARSLAAAVQSDHGYGLDHQQDCASD